LAPAAPFGFWQQWQVRWCKLCIKVAANDMDNHADLLTVAEKEMGMTKEV
jgi:hypothetical protein